MKKFIAKLLLALLPIGLYLALFILFEPNNYFGLKGADAASDSVIAKVRGYDAQQATHLILGDSRMNHFDMALVEEVSAQRYDNLAFGGASLEESLDLFDYLYARSPNLEQVVLGVSFYTFNQSYGSVSRMSTIEAQLQNPLAYIFNLEYNINAATNLLYTLQGIPTGGEDETAVWSDADYIDPSTGQRLPYRRDLIAYAATLYTNCAKPDVLPSIVRDENGVCTNPGQLLAAMEAATPAQSKFSINQAQLTRLEETAQLCAQAGISLVLVLPPMHQSVAQLVCRPLGIDTAMAPALARLAACGATVLDYEWANPPAFTDGQFFDGFHIDTVYGMADFTRLCFGR